MFSIHAHQSPIDCELILFPQISGMEMMPIEYQFALHLFQQFLFNTPVERLVWRMEDDIICREVMVKEIIIDEMRIIYAYFFLHLHSFASEHRIIFNASCLLAE